MNFNQSVLLKNGTTAQLRNGNFNDGKAVFDNFNQTHAQTDYLLSYPDENSFDANQEAEFLRKKTESENEIEILALLDGKVVGTAGYIQLELDVVADNKRAITLYERAGFREYGRNPKGFRSKQSGFQELVLMRLEL